MVKFSLVGILVGGDLMLQSILSNIAIILLMHLFMSMDFHFKNKYSKLLKDLIAITITSISVIAMFYLPINIYDNFWIDMRLIPLVFLAYLQGWKVAIPTLAITSAWSLFMGTSSILVNVIFGMVLPTLFTLLFHHRSNIKGKYFEKISIMMIAWLISNIPIIFLIPNGLEIFRHISIIQLITYVLTAIVLYTFIMQDRQHRFLQDKLEKLAAEDSLTKLLNKRKFLEVVQNKCKSVKSRQFLAMLDLDHFKNVNDSFGHLVGDKVLKTTGEILKKYEKENIIIGRYGGEEFIIYIEHDNPSEVIQLIQQIRKEIRTSLFAIGRDKTLKLTVSIGLAEFDENVTFSEAIHLADQFLYSAKQNGRDCVVFDYYKKIS